MLLHTLFSKKSITLAALAIMAFLLVVLAPNGRTASASTPTSIDSLTIVKQIQCRTAIEQVYWDYRLWPAENPGPKPAFETAVPATAIRDKVEDNLRRVNALRSLWQQEITADMLQAELNRMAADTQQPQTLAAIWHALDNDPTLIAQCLARPALTNRLLRNFYEGTTESETTSYSSWWAANAANYSPTIAAEIPAYPYTLPAITGQTAAGQSFSQGGDTWQSTPAIPFYTDGAAVWSGSEMLIFGGSGSNQGYLYDPATDTWDQMNMLNVPQGRREHTAVWTGTEMIVWGGCTGSSHACDLHSGGRYNPVTNTWVETALPGNVSSRSRHAAVWTGEVMIVWGGCRYAALDSCSIIPQEGGRYDPDTDTWQPTTLVNAATGRTDPNMVWAGNELIIAPALAHLGGRYDPVTDTWLSMNHTNAPTSHLGSIIWTGSEAITFGGCTGTPNCQTAENTGSRYDPAADTWTPTSTTNAPSGRWFHRAIWTGDEMIVWGGTNGSIHFNSGGRYDPATDSWTAVSTTNAPDKRHSQQMLWTGDLMLVWGGRIGGRTGGRYDPAADSWTPISENDPQSNRAYHAAVWTGTEMIIWGGGVGVNRFDFGSVYDAVLDEWWLTSSVNTPHGFDLLTAVWSGVEMLVWGGNGSDSVNSGGRFNPATDTWTMMSDTNAPDGRANHSAVWSGTELIIWGGSIWTDQESDTGGRYNPATDTWTPTTTANAPEGRRWQTAVWADGEMIVWGGRGENGELNTGGRYDPVADAWTAVTTTNAPSVREFHSAVWSGSEMVIWGGGIQDTGLAIYNDGGRYDPTTDTWTPTTMTNAPGGRIYQVTVWSGEEMIVWGGCTDLPCFWNDTTGGRYDPAADTWQATNLFHAPEQRLRHTAVWTGKSMIIWGGNADQSGITHTGSIYYPTAFSNSAPAVTADAFDALENETLVVSAPGVLGNDSDPDGDPITAMLLDAPADGTIALNRDGSFSYTPDPGFFGMDSFTYEASDGLAHSAAAAVTITVEEVPNQAPTAVNDDYTMQQDEILSVAAPGILGNDSDPDGDPLTAVLETSPTNGQLTLNPDGSFAYTPDSGFFGTDTYTYIANDGQTNGAAATVTITVEETANSAPNAADDEYTVQQDETLTAGAPGVLANDGDPDGDPLTAELLTNPTNGSVTLNPDGSFTYTPAPGFFGTDTFTYQIDDGQGGTDTAVVTITITETTPTETYTTYMPFVKNK